jgi:hypothetical protein
MDEHGSGDERPWWASDGAKDDPAAGETGRPAGEAWSHPSGEVCQICPLCSLLRVVDEARPEIVEHLTEAARHLSLAAKAIVDSYAAGYADRDETLERIDLEDD